MYRDGGRPSSQEEEALFSNGMECKHAKSLSPWMKTKVMTLGSLSRTEEFPWGFITAATEEQGNKTSLRFSSKALHVFPPCLARRINTGVSQKLEENESISAILFCECNHLC